jgi:rhodanese-related sulfurtransferase
MKPRTTPTLKICLAAMAMLVAVAGTLYASESKPGAVAERIGPEEARELVTSEAALLVCSYSDNRCKSVLLEGALLRSELDDKLKDLPTDQRLIFYCG